MAKSRACIYNIFTCIYKIYIYTKYLQLLLELAHGVVAIFICWVLNGSFPNRVPRLDRRHWLLYSLLCPPPANHPQCRLPIMIYVLYSVILHDIKWHIFKLCIRVTNRPCRYFIHTWWMAACCAGKPPTIFLSNCSHDTIYTTMYTIGWGGIFFYFVIIFSTI